jgi:metal-responsive CopG/Arc/MetJ family transcriptional regulator
VRKHPVSIALSNRVLEKIDKEASKQKRSRSEYVELHFESLFFNSPKVEMAQQETV